MSWDWSSVWEQSRSNWHWPQLPRPREGRSSRSGEFPFENYRLTLSREELDEGPTYVENLFDHLIVHYFFCPRSLETAGLLALAALKGQTAPRGKTAMPGQEEQSKARAVVNIFSDVVVDSFRLERSQEDEEKVLLGWRRLSRQELSALDKLVVGFLEECWGVPLLRCRRPEVDLLLQVFSLGVRDRSLWQRQCQQTARILEPFLPGLLGAGNIPALEILNGSAHAAPLAFASGLEPEQYQRALAVLGLQGDLKRWYRDQSGFIEIRSNGRSRTGSHPSSPARWRLTDPLSELDIAYSLTLCPRLIPGVTTYKRETEFSRMAPGREAVPDLLVVLDSSRSMEGPSLGTKTHRATLAAFKACQFAHQQGSEIAAINFSQKYLIAPWTRDLNAVEDVLVEWICERTSIPGKAVLELAEKRPGCLILCITDTHIQNLYQEWDHLKKASKVGQFVLFCIDQASRDRHVEESLRDLGRVFYIDRLEDLVNLVVETTGRAFAGESFISSE